jgi:hypothetical protein
LVIRILMYGKQRQNPSKNHQVGADASASSNVDTRHLPLRRGDGMRLIQQASHSGGCVCCDLVIVERGRKSILRCGRPDRQIRLDRRRTERALHGTGPHGIVTEWNPTLAGVALDHRIGVEVCWPSRPREAVSRIWSAGRGSLFKRCVSGSRFRRDAWASIFHVENLRYVVPVNP